MRHTKKWRLAQFDEIKDLVSKYKVIAIGNLDAFPASLLQKLKKNLESAIFKVTSRNVLVKVLEKENHKDIIEKMPNQPILILTNDDAFKLYSLIKKNKAKSKAKVGMVSPIDIIVPEGDTGLPPGPALSDLKKVGIKAQVRGATIYVPNDTVVTKEGDIISSDVVSTLSKLDIKPIELILDISAVKEDGLIYSKDVLNVDADELFAKFCNAVRAANNLGVEICYEHPKVLELVIMKAQRQANALSDLNKKE